MNLRNGYSWSDAARLEDLWPHGYCVGVLERALGCFQYCTSTFRRQHVVHM